MKCLKCNGKNIRIINGLDEYTGRVLYTDFWKCNECKDGNISIFKWFYFKYIKKFVEKILLFFFFK